MMYMDRAKHEQPKLLKDNWEKWTKGYLVNLKKNPKHILNMQNSEPKKKAYDEIIDKLLEITKQHCAFCDSFPLGNRTIKPTIEHFKPKAKDKFPELAYEWGNLFPCCHYCQEKGDKFDEKLLKPDTEGYDFYNYFEFDDSEWEIQPTKKPDVSDSDKERAKTTIDIYKLNGKDANKGSLFDDVRVERKRIMNQYLIDPSPNIDDYPFRFMFY